MIRRNHVANTGLWNLLYMNGEDKQNTQEGTHKGVKEGAYEGVKVR